jgi:tetratricopeptide (TPR) repeat protein
LLSADKTIEQVSRGDAHTLSDVAWDYAHAGLFAEASALFLRAGDTMSRYAYAWCVAQQQPNAKLFLQASQASPDYVFPQRIESVMILQKAIELNPRDARAHYYLGNFWYAHRQHADAIACWEQSRKLDPNFATVHRNLGVAYVNKLGKLNAARAAYARAFALDPSDARVLFEQDQLRKLMNVSPKRRLALLKPYVDLIARRDDLTIEYVSLLNMTQQPDKAMHMLMQRNFHPWEGGEGKAPSQYVAASIALAQQHMRKMQFTHSIEQLTRALDYPPNLAEGKLPNALDNNIHYFLGEAYTQLKDAKRAREQYELAARGSVELTSAMYYNDQPPEMIFYQGLARLALNKRAEATAIFRAMIAYSKKHIHDEVRVDYFAVSLPTLGAFDDDMRKRHQIHCHFMAALGHFGMRQWASARDRFAQALSLDANHQGARFHLDLMQTLEKHAAN